jgi:outer membrane protein
MKYLQLLVLAVLLISCNKKEKLQTEPTTPTVETTKEVITSNNSGLKIGFILSDTVLNRYTYYQKIKANLTGKGQKIESEIASRTKAMQAEYEGYQAKGQSMSPKELQAAEMSLMKKQQELEAFKNQRGAELMKEEEKLNKDLQKRIDDFLQQYATKNGYTYILSKHAGGSVLFGLKSLDVTDDVIKGLNASEKK